MNDISTDPALPSQAWFDCEAVLNKFHQNHKVVMELLALFDEESQPIIDLFLTTYHQLQSQADSAGSPPTESEIAVLVQKAHGLKGMAMNLCMSQLLQTCQDLHDNLKHHGASNILPLLSQTIDDYQQTRQVFEDFRELHP